MRKLFLAACLAAMTPHMASAAEEEGEGVVTGMMAVADRLDLMPGQSIVFTPDRGKMMTILFVEGPWKIGEGQIKLEFTSAGGQASLVVENRTATPFRYSAEILKKAGAKKGKKTSTCTLIPAVMAFETWPQEIAALRVSDFAAAPEGEMVCR
jgi:hypothetical protein